MPTRAEKSAGWHGQAYSLARGLVLNVPVIVFVAGCGSPSAANIELRKQNQDLQDQVTKLTRAREGDAATITALQQKVGTLPTLPQERLEKLFTTHGLKLGRLTGGADLDRSKPGDEALKVYADPTDDDGDPIKAAGSFIIEAFDLAANPPELGKWTFDTHATRKLWIGSFLTHEYVLTCPWQKPPQHEELTIKVTFKDELTSREFHEQTVVKIHPPPATSNPALTATPASP